MKKIGTMIILSMFLLFLSPSIAPVQQAHASDEWTAVVTTDGSNLNVRSGPGANYSIIGKFANGTVVNYGAIDPIPSADWTYVWGKDINGKSISGYCHNDYLR